MRLTITYNNGNTITEKVNYLHFESGKLCYTVQSNPSPLFREPVRIPLENIKIFDMVQDI